MAAPALRADGSSMVRGASKFIVVALVVLSAATPAIAARSQPAGATVAVSALEAGLLAEVNQLRAKHGLASLRLSRPLTAAADAHSRSMTRRGFFAHESANGSAFWKRIRNYYGSKGYTRWSVGENLAWRSPSTDAATTLQMWLNSPPHRKVLLTAKWREIGLSAVSVASAPGVYNGLPVTVITADFGVRG